MEYSQFSCSNGWNGSHNGGQLHMNDKKDVNNGCCYNVQRVGHHSWSLLFYIPSSRLHSLELFHAQQSEQ
eukprot:2494732-Amphidinium_carterae.2